MTATPRRLRAELAFNAGGVLAEGPFWDAGEGVLVWVDITGPDETPTGTTGAVHRYDPATGRDTATPVGTHVGAAVPRAAGGLLLAVRDGFATLDDDGTVTPVAPVVLPGGRMNDGRTDPLGRFLAGGVEYHQAPGAAALHRLDPDRTVHTLLDGVTCSNGLAWTDGGRTLWYIDTPTGGVDRFDYDLDEGVPHGRRRVVTLADDEGEPSGSPDGMAADADGCLWVAVWGAGQVRRYTPDGRLDTVVDVPGVTQTTSCAFGGPDGDVLWITTAREHFDAARRAAQPDAGGVFAVRPGIGGPPPTLAAV